MLLSGKVRRLEEEETIKCVLESVFKRKIDTATFYDGSLVALDFKAKSVSLKLFEFHSSSSMDICFITMISDF